VSGCLQITLHLIFEHQTGGMTLRFKNAGVIRSNGRQNWHISYEEAITSGVKYNWAEDYEI